MANNNCFEKAEEFEKKYGAMELLRIAVSSLNRLLIKKGIVTKEEIQQSFLDEIEKYKKE